MSKAIDLTGQRFGKLLVVGRAPNGRSPSGESIVRWWCLCDCQADKENPDLVIKIGTQLRAGHGWSCGCDVQEKRSKSLTQNLVGQKFGRLTVLEYAGTKIYGKKSKSSNALWKCVCDCQLRKPQEEWEYCYLTTNELTSGNTQSCGCYGREKLIETLHARKTQNVYEHKNGFYIGYTKKGQEFYVDEQDFELIKDYKWFIDANGYVTSHLADDSFVLMHRLIMGLTPKDKLEVDHICGEGTTNDNRRYNLRITTHAENQMNRKKQSNNTSGVIGVWFKKTQNKWVAEIDAYGKNYNLGQFDTIDEAAEVRREAENILHGNYSYRNSQFYGNKKLQELESMSEEKIIC